MVTSLVQKLKIKQGFRLLTINAPFSFLKELSPLPKDVKLSRSFKNFNQIHWFVANKAQLENELSKILLLLNGEVVCWVYYPKRTSKMQTDLTRDKGWDALIKNEELIWISLISFNETWSAFGCRIKTEADTKKDSKPKPREVFNYIDTKTKIIRLPEDLASVLKKNKQQAVFFNSLSFTNKKEYVEWIVTAKREETRKQRLIQTIERLNKEWKNPSNR